MPGLPFSPPVTLDELYRNIIHDAGAVTETVTVPTTLKELLIALNAGTYNTSLSTFGSGIDGPLQFTALANGAGSVTLWNANTITASANVYTLAQDLWLGQTANSTGVVTWPVIAAGVTINANGFRIFCQGLLQNLGTIESNGVAAAANTAGTTVTYTSTLSATTVGSAGGAGNATGNTVGVNNPANSVGGVGGTGGNGNAHNGAAGGTAAAPGATVELPFSAPWSTVGKGLAATAAVVLAGGSGGGAGGGDGTNLSGGGGSGGGIVVVAAQRIAGTGSITANGGAGGAAAAAGNAGGGGGGGGGLVLVTTRNINSLSVSPGTATVTGQTISATGGAGGAGFGSGNTGSAGANGTVVLVPA